MASYFDICALKGNEVLYLLMKDQRIPLDNAGRILRAVLYTIRNHISVRASMQILARLPMALKGIYVDQWDISENSQRIHHVRQFLDEIRSCYIGLAGYDFVDDESATQAVKAVFRTLRYYLSEGEFEDIIAVLPQEIKVFARSASGLTTSYCKKPTDHTHTLP